MKLDQNVFNLNKNGFKLIQIDENGSKLIKI